MKKYSALLKYEIKTILKDSFGLALTVYPLLMLIIIGFVLPAALKKASAATVATTLLLMICLALSIIGYMGGVLLGFSLIENKDENTISAIAVTPVSVNGYLIFKIIYTYLYSIIANLVLIGGLRLFAYHNFIIEYNGNPISLLENISWLYIVVFSLVNSVFVPAVALLLAALAGNKIEGFAFLKAGGIILIIPLLSLLNFFQNGKQYLLGIIPNFWPLKAMINIMFDSQHPSDLNYYFYMLIGFIYMAFLAVGCFKLFVYKLKTTGK
ncbi:MAG: hypothetical protein M0R05_04365 [Bacilli bacterium]|nr:hypothetical protein [Bacilli bacterium]MDD4077540.1 hypothetical protein [Bacilli bacterium]